MILETERLLLRPWVESDAQSLYVYAKDPRIGPPAGWPPHSSVEDSRQIIREVLSGPECYAVCRKDGVAIGAIALKMGSETDLTDRADEAEVGYWIGVPFWGRGYMPEAVRALQHHAFFTLGMNALWCAYYDGNEKSRRVMEKCGFRYHHTTEGIFLPRMQETRTGHVTYLSKSDWNP